MRRGSLGHGDRIRPRRERTHRSRGGRTAPVLVPSKRHLAMLEGASEGTGVEAGLCGERRTVPGEATLHCPSPLSQRRGDSGTGIAPQLGGD